MELISERRPLEQLTYRKARDLPVEDEPQEDEPVNVDQRSYSIGDSPWLSFAKVAAVVSGMLGAGWIGSALNAPQEREERSLPAISQDHDTQYELRLID